jgi:hypothetical protein
MTAGLPAGSRLPLDAVKLTQFIAEFDLRQHAGGHNLVVAEMGEAWRRWYAALLTDADATFDVKVTFGAIKPKAVA